MKVCTDACLFGAIAANYKMAKTNCLDIGTGTGLLSLMLAQKNNEANIDAVEINKDAAGQAMENISASPWANSISVINEDILTFSPGKKYDCIISNPPFFEDDLQSADGAKNDAKHDTTLRLEQLIQYAAAQLSPKGIFAVLLPFHRANSFIAEAERSGLYPEQKILVKQTLKHKYFRGILFLSRTSAETANS